MINNKGKMEFPIIDTFIVCPEEGKEGKIAICTNSLAPTMVVNEIPFEQRTDVSVIGSLIVNRDGAERMIVNCLSHPTLKYIILFGEESASFCPSTNLLLALMDGYESGKEGNFIAGGRGLAHQYPSLTPELLDQFRQNIRVIPIYKHKGQDEIVRRYIEWVRRKLPNQVYECLTKIHGKKKIYYDSLNEMISVLSALHENRRAHVDLDPKDFQHLQPPIVEIDEEFEKPTMPFEVRRDSGEILVKLDIGEKRYKISGFDSFLIAYSIMKHMNANGLKMPFEHQLFLGVELSRVEMEIKTGIITEPAVDTSCKTGERELIELQSNTVLKPDEEYYYRIALKKDMLAVQSLTTDVCAPVFEFRSSTVGPIIRRLAAENRFQDYEQQFLHRADVGIEIGRAAIAIASGNSFFQDFRNLFKINKTNFPLMLVDGDSFLANHKQIITQLYTTGLTMQHPDPHKGLMRSGTILAVYRRSDDSLKNMPAVYGSGSQTTQDMRLQYKDQLMSSDDRGGAYTYGERTRKHFGMDQLDAVVDLLSSKPEAPAVIQRFDFAEDMEVKEIPVLDDAGNVLRTRLEATHDPCLTHDIYFIMERKLYSFHIARAHNIVNAYPENIFGLHDAYDSHIASELGIELGDMFMLSNRGNILLLTEEQKLKKLMAEPSKPVGQYDSSAGPADLSVASPKKGVGYCSLDLVESEARPSHPCLSVLEDYEGQDIIDKAAKYLKTKGETHNNPVIGTYNPRDSDDGESRRLIFFQCNQRGGKLHASAVFLNGTRSGFGLDVELCNHIATRYARELELPLGKLFLFYVPVLEK